MTWERQLVARTMAQEARGEPPEGRVAVAHVLKNRAATGRWGETLASVCLWHAQFSGWWCPRGTPSYHDPNFAYACGLGDDDPVLSSMTEILNAALATSDDPTNGATHYYAESIAPPAWVAKATFCGKFGHQLFYKDVT